MSAVIPTHNEAANLPYVFARLPAHELFEVIIVDGHSTDGTVEIARGLLSSVRIVLAGDRGKGNALACGFAAARGDIIVMLDGDGSTDPAEIPAFLDALFGGADFAKGSRFAEGGHSHDITPLRRIGNRFGDPEVLADPYPLYRRLRTEPQAPWGVGARAALRRARAWPRLGLEIMTIGIAATCEPATPPTFDRRG